MANNKTIETLERKFDNTRRKLERAEREQIEIEEEIYDIKKAIANVLAQLETEASPTGLYNKGYKLQEKEHKIILTDRHGEEVCSFNHAPTLSDLMDIERQHI